MAPPPIQRPTVVKAAIAGLGAVLIVEFGLALLAGHNYQRRLDSSVAFLNAFATIQLAQADSPSGSFPQPGTLTTLPARDVRLEAKTLRRQAEHLANEGLLTNTQLVTVRRELATGPKPLGPMVPAWAPFAINPDWAPMLVWVALLVAEALGVAAILRSSRRGRRPPITV